MQRSNFDHSPRRVRRVCDRFPLSSQCTRDLSESGSGGSGAAWRRYPRDAAGTRISVFVLGAKETVRLDVALVEQSLEQVVGLAHTDAKTFGELPLAGLWLVLKDSEDAQVSSFGRDHTTLLKNERG